MIIHDEPSLALKVKAIFYFPSAGFGLFIFQEMPKKASSPGKQLHDACKSGEIAAVRKLLDNGVDMNWKNTFGDTALIYASVHGHVEIIKLLLDRGAQIDTRDNIEGTALMNACFHGKIDCVRLLLDRGADTSLKDEDGIMAKDVAVENGKVDIVQLLDEVCMFQTQDKKVFKYRYA
jgi:ankyrin repeat protein